MKRSILSAVSVIALAFAATPAFGLIIHSGVGSQLTHERQQVQINARNSRSQKEHYETLNARNSRSQKEHYETLNARNSRSEKEHYETLNS